MNIAIVGASGAVGKELLIVLEEQNFPITNLLLFGSKRSSGKVLKFRGDDIIIKELSHNDDFKGVDIAFVSAGGSTSIEYASTITKHGTIMIDNSSAFRMDSDVPLVVPEVNPKDALTAVRGIIANPNCTTIQMVVVLNVINKIYPIRRVHVATYQSASGAGASAMEELENQIKQVALEKDVVVDKFPHQLAYNLIPQVDVFSDEGYTKEELKMYNETRKILHSDIQVSATCVRVPVLRAHSEAIWVECEDDIDIDTVKKAFACAVGIELIDDISKGKYPMPLFASGEDSVYVGRVRADLTNRKGLAFWCVSDQIKKGAALNAVQIAKYIISHK